MSKVIKIRKGLDIPIVGEADRKITDVPNSETFAIKPLEFKGLSLKLVVKIDDEVKIGTPILHDKANPDIVITAPVSGKVTAINRGERRSLLEVVIKSDKTNSTVDFENINRSSLDRKLITEHLLKTGLWAFITQRPFGLVANPENTPRDIFISTFDSSPLAPDISFIIEQDKQSFEAGVEILQQLTSGKVHLGLNADKSNEMFENIKGVEKHYFTGPHPAGNVGIQIHHIAPIIEKDDIVWTIRPQDVQNIGRYFSTGKLDFQRIIAITGSEVINRSYVKTTVGANFEPLLKNNVSTDKNLRYISGNPLTGSKEEASGFLGFYHDQITVIPEGDEYEFMGWAMPRFSKYSASKAYFSWLFPKRKFVIDANTNGDERAFVVTSEYEKYLPMNILPVYLLKAIITKDIDKMEQLGIYEVIEEDLALCEFACTSKIEVQKTLREGIEFLISEL